ncbi:NAD(P)-dependent oxidoreductase [Levilactobacillus enshiensis]|uniref:NAD(P)-dependent oxidoreductase n=1 Tax=Levilactobacillus enshiensis TaxID=2590213 RepID=UPI00117B1E56|nr:NAD(P)-dependent oxidoreductase [Levilactobacillus enshiensis]
MDAVSAWTPATFAVHTDGISHIAQILANTKTRYLKVGGAGTLYINADHTRMLKDREDYPQDWLPLADVLVASLARLRSYSNLAWTYVTPAFNYDAEGSATGNYHIDGEDYLAKNDADSYISYADFAMGILDVLEQQTYIRQRITLVGNTH